MKWSFNNAGLKWAIKNQRNRTKKVGDAIYAFIAKIGSLEMEIAQISGSEAFDEVLLDPTRRRHHAIHHVVLDEILECLARLNVPESRALTFSHVVMVSKRQLPRMIKEPTYARWDQIGREAEENGAVGPLAPRRIWIAILFVIA